MCGCLVEVRWEVVCNIWPEVITSEKGKLLLGSYLYPVLLLFNIIAISFPDSLHINSVSVSVIDHNSGLHQIGPTCRMPPKKMDTKVAALEEKIATMEVSLKEMQNQTKENQEKIISLLSLSKGKNAAESSHNNESVSTKQKNSELHGDALDEFRLSVKKVELPMFNGDDPAGWIARAEVYFRVQDTRPKIKVNLAQLCMDGATIHFFKGLMEENENLSWEALKDALLERYGGVSDGNIFEQLSALQQEETVEEYIEDFERLISQIPRLPNDQYIGYFVHGLKESIRGKVRSLIAMGSVSRPKLMDVARAIEGETEEGNKGWFSRKRIGSDFGLRSQAMVGNRSSSNFSNRFPSNHRPINNDWIYVKGNQENCVHNHGTKQPWLAQSTERTGPATRDRETRDRGVRSLSSREIAERRQKGLYFKCGGPLHPRHQCPDRNVRVMVMEEELEEGGEVMMMKEEIEEGGEEELQLSVMTNNIAWEDTGNIATQFPNFNLEDKVVSHGEGSDSAHVVSQKGKPVIWRVYERRNKKNKRGE